MLTPPPPSRLRRAEMTEATVAECSPRALRRPPVQLTAAQANARALSPKTPSCRAVDSSSNSSRSRRRSSSSSSSSSSSRGVLQASPCAVAARCGGEDVQVDDLNPVEAHDHAAAGTRYDSLSLADDVVEDEPLIPPSSRQPSTPVVGRSGHAIPSASPLFSPTVLSPAWPTFTPTPAKLNRGPAEYASKVRLQASPSESSVIGSLIPKQHAADRPLSPQPRLEVRFYQAGRTSLITGRRKWRVAQADQECEAGVTNLSLVTQAEICRSCLSEWQEWAYLRVLGREALDNTKRNLHSIRLRSHLQRWLRRAKLQYKTREIVAIRFVLSANARRRGEAWEAWVAQVERRWETEELLIQLSVRFDTQRLKRTWMGWVQAAKDIHQCRTSAGHVAEVFCSMQRAGKAFSTWQSFIGSEKTKRHGLREARQSELRADMSTLAASIAIMEQRQLAVAVAHLEQNFRARQLNYCMDHWHVHTSKCSHNRRLAREMARRLQLDILGTCFAIFLQHMQHVKALLGQANVMAARKDVARQLACLKAWKTWKGQQEHRHRRDEFAAAVRNSSLARQCCDAWFAAVVHDRKIKKALENHKAKRLRVRCTASFQCWHQYLGVSKLIDVRLSSFRARICSRQGRVIVQAWQALTSASAVLRRRVGRIHANQSFTKMTAAFHCWEMFFRDSNATSHLQVWTATRIRNRKLKQVLVQWHKLWTFSHRMRAMSKMVGRRASSLVKRRALTGWRYRVTAQRGQSRLTAKVVRILARNRLRHILRAMHVLARSSHRLHVLVQQCVRRGRRKATVRVFLGWLHVCHIHALAGKAARRLRQRLCGTVFREWSQHVANRLHARARANALVARHRTCWCSRGMRTVWARWTLLTQTATWEVQDVVVPLEQEKSALEAALAKKTRLKDLLRCPEAIQPTRHVPSPAATVEAWERVISASERIATTEQRLAPQTLSIDQQLSVDWSCCRPMLLAWSDWTRARAYQHRTLHDAICRSKSRALRCSLSSWHEQANWSIKRRAVLQRARAARLAMTVEVDRANAAAGDLKIALQEKCIEEECLREQVQLANARVAQTAMLSAKADRVNQKRASIIQRLHVQGAELLIYQKEQDQQADAFREWAGLVRTKKQNGQLIDDVRNRAGWLLRRIVWQRWSFHHDRHRRLVRFTTHKLTRWLSLILTVWRVIVGASWRTRAALSAARMEHADLCSAFDRKITAAVANTKTRQLHTRQVQMHRRLEKLRLRLWLHAWQSMSQEESARQRVAVRLFHRHCARIRYQFFHLWSERYMRARLQHAAVERLVQKKELSTLTIIVRCWLEYSAARVQVRSLVFRLHRRNCNRIDRTVIQGVWHVWAQLLAHRRHLHTQHAAMQAHEHEVITASIQVRQRAAAALYRRTAASQLRTIISFWRATCLRSRGSAVETVEPFVRQLSIVRARRMVARVFWHWHKCRRDMARSVTISRFQQLQALTMASVHFASWCRMRMIWSAWRGACAATVSRDKIMTGWSDWGAQLSQRTRALALTGAVLRGWSSVVMLRRRRVTVEEMALKLRVRQAVRSAFASWQFSHEESQCARMKYQIANSRLAVETLIAKASRTHENAAYYVQNRHCQTVQHHCLSRWRALVARKKASAYVYLLGIGSRVALSQTFTIWRLQVRAKAATAATQTAPCPDTARLDSSTQTTVAVLRNVGCEAAQITMVSTGTQSTLEGEMLIAKASRTHENAAYYVQNRHCQTVQHHCLSRWRALVARKKTSAYVYLLGIGSRVALSQTFTIWRLQVRAKAATAATQTAPCPDTARLDSSTQTTVAAARILDLESELVPVKENKSEVEAEANEDPKCKMAVDASQTAERSPTCIHATSSSIAAEVAAIAAAVASATESVLQDADVPATLRDLKFTECRSDVVRLLASSREVARDDCVTLDAHSTARAVEQDQSASINVSEEIASVEAKAAASHQATTHPVQAGTRLASFDGPFGRWAKSRIESTTVKTPTSSSTTTHTYYCTTGGVDRERQSGFGRGDRPLSSESIHLYDTLGFHGAPLAQQLPMQHERPMSQQQRMDIAAAAADQAAAEAEASLEELRRLAY